MSLDNIEVVDAIGTENESDTVVLSIIDSWDWDDVNLHLAAIQNKLNAYFGFIESEQIYETYPSAIGKSVRIDILSRYPVPKEGLKLFQDASNVASRLNIRVNHIFSKNIGSIVH
ncbi:DUF6572 domain-containing protein (plasmid) [Methylomonas sp. 2BW1-5-20]|uniref:DUF6572 domain-containing protein n=1 Tax=Methylomonas sp. 2BW1-5-20 TaxID=3376686 RepID=UPI00404EF6EA